jgi:hypothetical protein
MFMNNVKPLTRFLLGVGCVFLLILACRDAQMVKKVLPPEGVRGLFSGSR